MYVDWRGSPRSPDEAPLTHHARHGIITHTHNPQVLDVKKIQPNPGQAVAAERFRLVISDGTHYLQAMLATQLNHLVANNQIQPNGLLSLQVRLYGWTALRLAGSG